MYFEHHPIYIREKRDFLNLRCDADLVIVTISGIIYEFEIKKSRADFLRDKKKLRTRIYSGKFGGLRPHKFYYAIDSDFVKENEVPDFAGLVIVENGRIKKIKGAPVLRKEKHELKIYLRLAESLSNKTELYSNGSRN
jgi:hypothetical protein